MTMTAPQAAARVTGFNTAVQWNHFRQLQNPPSALDAHIDVGYRFDTGTAQLQGGLYRFNNLRATVTINRGNTWVRMGWYQNASVAERNRLLRHEQGHYDLIRLAMRDLVQSVGSLEWSEAVVGVLREVGNSAREQLHWAQRKLRDDAAAAIQQNETLIRELAGTPPRDGLYDRHTDHGELQPQQDTWNRVFDRCVLTGESLGMLLWIYGVRPQP